MITYADKERAKYCPVSAELMAEYRDGTHTAKDWSNNLFWRNQDGELHRDDDLPSRIWADGSLEWHQDGKLHRDGDKPAFISAAGSLQWWCQNGQRHRNCGPATIYLDRELAWWINGKDITQEVNEWLAGEEWQGTPEQIVEFKLRFT